MASSGRSLPLSETVRAGRELPGTCSSLLTLLPALNVSLTSECIVRRDDETASSEMTLSNAWTCGSLRARVWCPTGRRTGGATLKYSLSSAQPGTVDYHCLSTAARALQCWLCLQIGLHPAFLALPLPDQLPLRL